MRVSLLYKTKPDSYTESCTVNAADRWRERNVWYPGRSVRNALKRVTIIER
ncbi:arginase [Lachnospiraceae bacterium KGMB03038]|nr:arginase [Lachnospiraceae bacterium KGMB03038]QDW74110.1 arginase [Lachnospiraceae bacterium KGMB03038]QDW74879.1 arginase [Lachnospiraceae bacterium KGMB03038]